MILKLLKTRTGRLRIMGFLEGISLVVLVFVAVPMKYLLDDESLTKMMGPIHGALFLLFLLNACSAGIEQKWKVKTIGMILASCFIPFGTFYVDYKFLKNIDNKTTCSHGLRSVKAENLLK
ncbi:DUF3817 domain-containing protein [Sphingobacterium olei]|uniref:DUF3817 domain-containing protein n=1 Tax=Sphingobacterium olei TaxID=2571155 RepID=UPI00192E4C18|nr:DUF3817 domain-containing protein [Sphingobacterium olei]